MFSIYILTHNEELDIAACIESALMCDDIIIVDSNSTDRTAAIARQYPVRFVEHAFESHGKQRTWMLREIPAKYDWIYILEADERMTAELFAECCAVVSKTQTTGPTTGPGTEPVGYFAAERVMFMGSWIRHSTQYPRYQMRLLRPDRVWFDDYGHTEREVCDGSTGFLSETYPHYTSGKGMSRWIEKHNRYSSREAEELIRRRREGSVNWQDLFSGKTEIDRRHALKDFSMLVPFRPIIRFLYMYLVLGGIWDGRAGLRWCILQMFYEYIIDLKAWEILQDPYAGIHDAQGPIQAVIPGFEVDESAADEIAADEIAADPIETTSVEAERSPVA
jgi:glycosyltransferase involved in cell wall biosynthesis